LFFEDGVGLPTPSAPYVRGSETSKAASKGVRSRVLNLRERVFNYIAFAGPCTDEQIAEALDMNPSTARPRRIELVNEGRVADSGRKIATKSGSLAVAWKINTNGGTR